MSSLEFYNEVTKIEKKIKVKTDINKSSHKNSIADNIDDGIVEILEALRRGK